MRRAKSPAITGDRDWWTAYVYWWLRAHVVHQEGSRVDCDALFATYLAWWRDPAMWGEPAADPTMREFGLALLGLCQVHGVQVQVNGDRAYCMGCRLRVQGDPAPYAAARAVSVGNVGK
jgi:hypothetical protein